MKSREFDRKPRVLRSKPPDHETKYRGFGLKSRGFQSEPRGSDMKSRDIASK